jgi:hypothetical protein
MKKFNNKFPKLIVIVTILNLCIVSNCLAQETNGMGKFFDKIFSMFQEIISNEQQEAKEERELMINELSKDGELSLEDLEKIKEMERNELKKDEEQAMESLNKMLDPEEGMFSGIIKKVDDKKNKQIKKLDDKIIEITSDIEKGNLKKAELKIIILKWVPIGAVNIDNEMTQYYEDISEDLMTVISKK